MDTHLDHFVKLIKKDLSDSDKENFIKLVKKVDPSVTSYYDDHDSVVVETSHSFDNSEVNKLFSECETNYEDFFLMASETENLEENKETPKEISKEDFKNIYEKMCDELEVRMHNRVVEKKSQLGWRHGDKFDPHEKTSPLMKPYHELPEDYKLKNGKIFMDMLDVLKNNGFTVSKPKK